VRSAQRVVGTAPALTLFAGAGVGVVALGLSMATAQEPAAALLVVAAMAVVFVCALRVDVALLLLVATGPLEGAFAFSEGSGLTIAKLAGALAFGSFLLYAISTHRPVHFDWSHALIAGILGLALLSTLQADDPAAGLSTSLRYASFVGLYVVVSQFVGDHALQRRIAWVLSVAGTVAAILMLQNFLGGGAYAATLTYGNSVDSAFILATTLPLTFWLLREGWAIRIGVVLMVGIMSAAIIFSFSRGAFVGLAAAAVVHLLTSRRHSLLIVFGVLAALVATFTLVRTNPGQVEAGLEGKLRVADYNVNTRLEAWRGATRILEDRPLLGVGPGNFQNHFYESTGLPSGTVKVHVVHNAYLDVGAELGAVALVLFLAYLGLVLWRSNAAADARAGPPGFAAAVRLSLVVAAVSSFFLSEQYYAPLWLFGALATALYRERRAPPPEP
jgi:putative inorganic carbon (HCO3(-)) transporter